MRVELENGVGLRLRIVDDRQGFDTHSRKRLRNGGFELVSMSERARSVGGSLDVEIRARSRHTVEVKLP